YNPTSADIDVTGCFFSDDASAPRKARINDTTRVPAHGYAVFWFDNYDPIWTPHHSDLKLDCDGDTLYVNDTQGRNRITFVYPPSVARCSWAATSDGGKTYRFCAAPTPGRSNHGSPFSDYRLNEPVVDSESRIFTSGTQHLQVTIPEGCTLIYTTDGSAPTRTNGQVSLSGHFTTSETRTFRFALFRDGYLPSPVVTRSLIKSNLDIDLPILAVTGTDKNFYDDSIGIFVKGVNGRPSHGPFGICNWYNDWERPSVVEYFSSEGQSLLNQEAGIKRIGAYSRSFTPRSFRVNANKRYEMQNTLPYPFFEEKPYLKHKSVLVRNGGSDTICRILDVALQQIVARSDINIDYQAYQPIWHIVNGVNKGTINLREPSNKHFVYANYGLDDDEIDQFEVATDSGYVQKCGTYESMQRLLDLSRNAASDEAYTQICQLLDIDEYCNYMAIEFYLRNGDWPENNCKGWRARTSDGRFRFVLFDLEAMDWIDDPFDIFEMKRISEFAYFTGHGTETAKIQVELQPIVLFLNLIKNPTFLKKFIDTFCLVASSTFDPDRCEPIIREICERVAPTQALYHNDSPWRSAAFLTSSLSAQRQTELLNYLKAFPDFKMSSVKAQSVKLRSNLPTASLTFADQPITNGTFNGLFFPPAEVNAYAPAGYDFVGWREVKTSSQAIFATSDPWSYYTQGSLDGIEWYAPSYNVASWPAGATPMGYDTDNKIKGFKTKFDYGNDKNNKRPTYYVRTSFNLASVDTLSENSNYQLTYQVDDGCILYLNGQEIYRFNMAPGTASYATYAAYYATGNPDKRTLILPRNLLKNGANVLAVEIHNEKANSPDICWSASLDLVTSLPGSIVSKKARYSLPTSKGSDLIAWFQPNQSVQSKLPPVVINEVSADNGIYINDLQKKADWIELYNTTSRDIDLRGVYISDKLGNPTKYRIGSDLAASSAVSTIIPAHGYKIIWCDQKEALREIHAPFKLENEEDKHVVLTAVDQSWADTLTYGFHEAVETVGRYPDAGRNVYRMTRTTIAKPNQLTSYSASCAQVHRDSLIIDADDGDYALEVLPFAFKSNTDIVFTFANVSEVANVSFDIKLPAAMTSTRLWQLSPTLSTIDFSTEAYTLADSTIHLSVSRKGFHFLSPSRSIDVAKLALSWRSSLPKGVYTISLQNIMVTDTEGRTFRAPSYTTEIYVGNSPVITPVNGVAAYHGNYGSAREHALLKASLPVGASIDLTEVSHYIDDPSIFLSGNVFFRDDLVAYGRKVSTQWGTLCLPYAVQSNDSLQFYTLVAASYNALTFEKAASIDANTPTLFKATGSSFIVSTSNDGSIPVDFASLGTNLSLPQQAIGWTFNGTYTDQTINASQMRAYTLSQDKFILAGKSLQVKAFNAWLRDNAAPVASSLSIIEKEASALPVIELPDGSVQLYYDLHGRPQPTPQPNQIHISPHQKSILTP
ncbi:MAG: CotH kinase family protein, partial [Bacteroidales bacterium]|nr:CotH kinase family protein [Bacteroidales bacterium]